jgi:hypothetical protein
MEVITNTIKSSDIIMSYGAPIENEFTDIPVDDYREYCYGVILGKLTYSFDTTSKLYSSTYTSNYTVNDITEMNYELRNSISNYKYNKELMLFDVTAHTSTETNVQYIVLYVLTHAPITHPAFLTQQGLEEKFQDKFSINTIYDNYPSYRFDKNSPAEYFYVTEYDTHCDVKFHKKRQNSHKLNIYDFKL